MTRRRPFRHGYVRDLARLTMFPPAGDLGRRERLVLYIWRLGRRVVARLVKDRCPRKAASLSFQTLLSVLPIAVVTFAALRTFGGFEGDAEIVIYLAKSFLPPAAHPAAMRAASLIERADLTTLGVVGVLSLLPVMVALMVHIESVYHDIFRMPRLRPLGARLGVHLFVVTVVPSALIVSLFYGRRYFYVPTIDRFVGPLAFSVLVLYLAIRLLPGAPVRNRAAIAGAVFSGLLFEGLKLAFGLWAARVARTYDAAWGPVAFLPIFMIWLYLFWMVILLGVELAASVHELELERERAHRESLAVPRLLRRPRWQRRVRDRIAERLRPGEPRDE